MPLKKFIHKWKEICGITQKQIDTQQEEWSAIIEFHGSEIRSVAYYKSEYLKELIKGNKEKIVSHLSDRISNTAKNILQNVGSVISGGPEQNK